eukprot:scaffold1313_cov250-Pinguiococcus_pyrenoidosus.AAC.9
MPQASWGKPCDIHPQVRHSTRYFSLVRPGVALSLDLHLCCTTESGRESSRERERGGGREPLWCFGPSLSWLLHPYCGSGEPFRALRRIRNAHMTPAAEGEPARSLLSCGSPLALQRPTLPFLFPCSLESPS